MSDRAFLKKSVVWIVLLVATISVFAKGSTNIRLSRSLVLNGTTLAPGEYRLNWTSEGDGVVVTFSMERKAVATAHGRFVDRDLKYDRSMLVFTTALDGATTLTEIRISGERRAITFDRR